MYTFFNVAIHLTFIGLLAYAMIPEEIKPRYSDMSLKKLAVFAAFGIFGLWTLFVGLVHNVKNVFSLF